MTLPALDETPTAPKKTGPGTVRSSRLELTLLGMILRRLAVIALLLVVVSFVVFSLLHLAPGNPVDILLGTTPRNPETVAALNRQYHLDEPFLQQYWAWASDAAQLRFGTSIQSSLPVSTELSSRLPTSLFLGLYAFVLTMTLGIGLGVLSAVRHRSALDHSTVAGTVVALSTPTFVLGTALLYAFAVRMNWFPAFGAGEGFLDRVWHLTLPALTLALTSCAYVVKHTRTAMIGVLDQDFIVFARARGLSLRQVLFGHALRNALIPVITMSGFILSGLVIGAVLVEVTFSVQGIGQLLVKSATAQDLPVIQAVSLLTAAAIMLTALLTDIVYTLADPRVRLGGRS
ncbi:ABC transporter permease [Streptomyces sp. NPDC004629]|uniref:ABC transporter permease n=1 Tax=Streptomyces sp. NPDC004629 TaxID=3364705 RepID=UPI0036784E7F